MALNVGDAVMSFLGDTTNLDQAFARIVDGADKAMGAASDSIGGFTDALNNSRSDVDAWNETVMNAMHDAGDGAQEAGEKISGSMHEARGSLKLIEESLGIHIPREMNTLIAGIPGLSSAFAAMLPVVGIVAAVDIIGRLIQRHEELAKAQEKAALEAENLAIKEGDQAKSMEIANLRLDDQIAKLEGRPNINRLKEALLESGIAADGLATRFAADFEKISEASTDATTTWAQFVQTLYQAGRVLDAGWGHIGEEYQKSAEGVDAVKNALKLVNEQMLAINKLRADQAAAKTEDEQVAAANALAAAYGELARISKNALTTVQYEAPKSTKTILELSGAIVSATAAQKDFGEQAENVHKRVQAVVRENAVASATVQEKAAKEALDAQLAAIKTWETAQRVAYVDGKTHVGIWLAAEIHATDAAAIAHESYLKRLVTIYAQAGEAQKSQEKAQELATLQTNNASEATNKLAAAMEKHRAATRKVVEEYAHLVDAGVAKDFEETAKAAQKLTAAEEELAKAQSKLSEDKLTQHYKDQEAAITKLAAMHLITESQKDDRLKLLEQEQSNAAIAILNDQMAKEEAAVRAAAAKLAQIKLSPGVSPAAIIEAETELKKLEAVVTNTEAEIVQTKEKFNKQSEADDKSHYGRALLLAMSYGAEMLAEQLKQNHADLLAAEAQLKQAKARGENTVAIEKQIEAMKLHEKQLEQEANGNKQLIIEEQKVTQTKILAAQAILAETKARGLDTTSIEKEIRDLQLLLKAQQQEVQELPRMKTAMQGVTMASEKLGDMLKNTAQEMDNAFASAIIGALASGKSIGQAMEQATATVLKNLATQALAHAIYCTAMGIAELATGVTSSSAAEWFAAAAEFGLVAGAAGAAGIAMSGTGGGGSSGNQGPQPGQVTLGGGAGGGSGSQQTGGVTHLAAGGVVTSPTIFMAGDGLSGGSADEAILPLSDSNAMRKIVNAIMPVMPQSAPGFGFATPAQRPPLGFDRSQPSMSERPDIHSGNPNDADFERSEASIPRDAQGMEALAASFGGLLSTQTRRAAAASQFHATSASASVATPAGFDAEAMEKFANRVGSEINSGGGVDRGGDTHIHNNIKGLISPDNLKKVIKQQNRLVQNRRAVVKASDSLRVTRRSQ
jgi:hypothetical protein